MQANSQQTGNRRTGDDLASLRAQVRALHAILPGLGCSAPASTETRKGA